MTGANDSGRDLWGTPLGFVLAAAGSAVGLGNLWKFPYITWHNGTDQVTGEPHGAGGFVLIYLLCICAVGIPIMVAELLLGGRARRNPVGTFKLLAPGRGVWTLVGWLCIAAGFTILSYYAVVAGWTLEYFARAVLGSFNGATREAVGDAFGSLISDPVRMVGYQAVFMLITILVVQLGISGGIERATRKLMPALFVILLLLCVMSLRLDGAGEALAFIFKPDFSLMTVSGVLEALGHSFFTLSLGMGAMITYGSYLKRDENLPRIALTVSVLDTLVAMVACIVIFPILFTYPEIEPSRSTAGILFAALPYFFTQMGTIGMVFGPLFFLLVGFAALSSTISLLEVVVAYFLDEKGWSRKRAVWTIGGTIFGFGTLSALSLGAVSWLTTFNPFGGLRSDPQFTQGFFSTMDYLASNWFLPVGGLAIAIFAGWVVDEKVMREQWQHAGARWAPVYPIWRFLIRYVSPLAVIWIIIAVASGAAFN